MPVISQYNLEGINYPSKIDDSKTFEKNNLTIDLNVLHKKVKEICPASIKKKNPLMILNKEKEGWHYRAIKKFSLRGLTSKHHGNFYYLNCPHFFRTENKLAFHKKI